MSFLIPVDRTATSAAACATIVSRKVIGGNHLLGTRGRALVDWVMEEMGMIRYWGINRLERASR